MLQPVDDWWCIAAYLGSVISTNMYSFVLVGNEQSVDLYFMQMCLVTTGLHSFLALPDPEKISFLLVSTDPQQMVPE